ncbi:TonB-dependent receptor [Maricaulis sp.]|uniref:TonB-dependent receptor plug domain-containing protein n=1 Tax=Maricaulis sp. TaxID=1486257 RepID=UPI0026120D89|nr:TonB-dependent receptor [Maricaulis sp.]
MPRLTSHLLRTTAACGLVVSGLALAPAALAQDETDTQADERIVVTGSRLRRDEFSAISPLQVIDGEAGRQIGITDTTQLIAESPVVSGVQLDGSINSGSPTAAVEGVPVNGPGAATVALRGLSAERTLLLVNGRRIGPSGVRGAPVAPDLNLIPSSMIDRIELLTDGASSVYGADAVAGVANIILRQEYDGLEMTAFSSIPENNGGEVLQASFIGGASNDRGNFTVAAEFYNRTAVIAGDRSHWNDCLRDIDVDETTGQTHSVCMDRRPDDAVFLGSQGFVWRTPGFTDVGIPGWSSAAGVLADTGQHFFEQDAYSLQNEERDTQLLENLERMNFFGSGFYDIDLFSRDTLYFELSYATRNSVGRFTNEQIFPGVPAEIPMEDANGNLLVNPDGSLQMFDNPLNPFDEDALPVYTTQGLAQRRKSDVSVFRAVGGLEGDVALPWFGERNWVYDVSLAYDRSYGTASQPIMNENAVREALDTLRLDVNGDPVCGLERTALSFGFLTPQDCVLVDFFSPTLFVSDGGNKRFATEAEENFLFGQSINITELEQVHFQSIFTGDVFDLPAGPVGLVLGSEFRENRINSINDITRVGGLAASEIPDTERPTVGRTSLYEVFAETEIPIFDTLTLNLSGRFTEEENFGDDTTYSVKVDWQATDFLRLRSTFGTTFRAPNLREQFLAGSTGTIGGGNDPCIVPQTANNGGVYDPSGETRSQTVLDNCVADGADPTQLGLLATTGITTQTGGSTNLEAETSESLTFGFVFQNSFGASNLDVSVTYFDIQVENTIEETRAQDLLANCYNNQPNLADPACDRITRNTGNPATATVQLVEAGFINVGLISSTGIDYNIRYNTPLDFIDDRTELTLIFNAAQYLEQLEQVDPASIVDDNVGEIGSPEWQAQFSAVADRGPWSLRWRTRYLGEGQQDNSDAPVATDPTGTRTACDLLGVTGGMCRDVDFSDAYTVHDLALTFYQDEWNLSVGVNNLTDETPPMIDQGEGPSRMNLVTQSGHDLIGRRAFITLSRRF